MSNRYQFNSQIRVIADFYLGATLTSPTIITLDMSPPQGQWYRISSSDVDNYATGRYRYTFTPSISGTWKYAWAGTGAVIAHDDKSFVIEISS